MAEAEAVPHRELDQALRPVRRVVGWAMRGGPQRAAQLRYFEVIAGGHLARAASLELPHEIRDQLAVLGGRLSGFDALEPEGRWARLSAIYPALWRLDEILGLPLESEALPRPPAAEREPRRSKGRGRSDEAPSRSRGRSRGKSKRNGARPKVAPEVEVASEEASPKARSKAHRWGEVDHTGTPLEDIAPGIAAALADAGLETAEDLLLTRPAGERRLKPVHGAGRDIPEGLVAVGGRVRARFTRLFPDGTRAGEALVVGAGPVLARWEGELDPWLASQLPSNSRVILAGRYVPGEDGAPGVLHEPELAEDDGHHGARLAAYPVEAPQGEVRVAVRRCLALAEHLRDPVPEAVLQRTGLPALVEALRGAHLQGSGRPDARRRLAFDEALQLQLGQAWTRLHGSRERSAAHAILHRMTASVCELFDLEISDKQQRALEEIKRDLRQPSPMLRVLTGEVGAGKGLVSLLAMVTVAESKSQVLFTAPDPISAELRYVFIEPFLRELGLVARLLVGTPSSAQRDALRRGEVHVVFGTSELLSAELEFRRLGLVVAEEHEIMGGAATMVGAMRPRPDLLVVTAAPVPAMVLLTAYAGHDVTLLPGQEHAPVAGELFSASSREEAYARAAEALSAGRQVQVVFPTVDDRDVLDMREARRLVSALEKEVFPGHRVTLFHGDLSRDERYRVYDDFRHHRSDVLVATTHFEDGPPVPDASVVVVEQADRMNGLRLHRVRGQVSQSRHPAECLFIIGEVPDEAGRDWVEYVASIADGFALSEEDLRRRGLAALVVEGTREPPRFRWFDHEADTDLLLLARREAHAALIADSGPQRGAIADLVRRARNSWATFTDEPCPLPASGGGRRRKRRRKR